MAGGREDRSENIKNISKVYVKLKFKCASVRAFCSSTDIIIMSHGAPPSKMLTQVLHCVPAVSESGSSAVTLGKMASAASMPLFMAVWVPLIFGTFMKPGLQPISSPPGNVSFGMDCRGRGSRSLILEL